MTDKPLSGGLAEIDGGDMGARIRAFPWATTPLGPRKHWPAPLQLALGICLTSSFPTSIYWGPEHTLLYNDAWAPIPGERHPAALGKPAREVWTDIWGVVGPQFAEVMATGRGFSTYDQLLPMVRNGAVQETYWITASRRSSTRRARSSAFSIRATRRPRASSPRARG